MFLCAALAGCVTVDGTLNSDGSGTVEMQYKPAQGVTEFSEKRRFTSPHVTVESLKIADDGSGRVKVHVDDAVNLSSAEGFRDVAIKRAKDGNADRLTLNITNPTPVDLKPDDPRPGPKITLTLPGKVLEANQNGQVTGNKVTWSFSLPAWGKQKMMELTVKYGAGAATTTAAPTTTTTVAPTTTTTTPAKAAPKAAPKKKK